MGGRDQDRVFRHKLSVLVNIEVLELELVGDRLIARGHHQIHIAQGNIQNFLGQGFVLVLNERKRHLRARKFDQGLHHFGLVLLDARLSQRLNDHFLRDASDFGANLVEGLLHGVFLVHFGHGNRFGDGFAFRLVQKGDFLLFKRLVPGEGHGTESLHRAFTVRALVELQGGIGEIFDLVEGFLFFQGRNADKYGMVVQQGFDLDLGFVQVGAEGVNVVDLEFAGPMLLVKNVGVGGDAQRFFELLRMPKVGFAGAFLNEEVLGRPDLVEDNIGI